ncbi:MAG: hypothetical protein EZS28_013146 [Streblomastix strix]|uniref:Uncharacterized protein n=1 Tax=Streblomastix strix TaxID=222440 RepID=A0A5J4W8S7_9EUKA|nr:MAG: hypothetical protein EZS28_013146 [Streblomastix strix]
MHPTKPSLDLIIASINLLTSLILYNKATLKNVRNDPQLLKSIAQNIQIRGRKNIKNQKELVKFINEKKDAKQLRILSVDFFRILIHSVPVENCMKFMNQMNLLDMLFKYGCIAGGFTGEQFDIHDEQTREEERTIHRTIWSIVEQRGEKKQHSESLDQFRIEMIERMEAEGYKEEEDVKQFNA